MGVRVLLADDTELMRKAIRGLLKELGSVAESRARA